MGHSRRFDRTTATFGLPPAADIVSAGRQVCFVPISLQKAKIEQP
jgi:hypothetical protein